MYAAANSGGTVMNIYADLFLTFAKIGCFTFGGGYAMLSLIEDICVRRKKWMTHDDMMNITVIAESTPGPIAINCASFAGFLQAGTAGAAAATLGMIVPSFLIIYAVSRFLTAYTEIKWIAAALQGIRIAAGILDADAGFNMLRKMKKTPFRTAVVLSAFLAVIVFSILSLHVSSILLMTAAAVAGLICSAAVKSRRTEDAK